MRPLFGSLVNQRRKLQARERISGLPFVATLIATLNGARARRVRLTSTTDLVDQHLATTVAGANRLK
jgi:hypothetical protein